MHELSDDKLEFKGIRMVQAKRECYLVSVPIRTLTHLFDLAGASLNKKKVSLGDGQAEMKAWGQRDLNPKRVLQIKDYVLTNREDYVLPPPTVSIDGASAWKNGAVTLTPRPHGVLGPKPLRIHVIDGQHRLAGLQLACSADPSIGEEHIGLFLRIMRSQSLDRQAFADINSTPCKVPLGRNVLFNGRDPIAAIVQELTREKTLTEYIDADHPSPRKPKLIAASGLYAMVKALLTSPSVDKFLGQNDDYDTYREFVVPYFEEMLPLCRTIDGIFSSLVVQTGFMQFVFDMRNKRENPESWEAVCARVAAIDWSRENWEGACVFGGALSKSDKLVSNVWKKLMLDAGFIRW